MSLIYAVSAKAVTLSKSCSSSDSAFAALRFAFTILVDGEASKTNFEDLVAPAA